MMRVTNTLIQRNATITLQQNLQAMAKAQAQVSSGQKYTAFSDDPQAQSSVMQASSSLRALDQYKRNIDDATSRANMEDSVLQQLGDSVTQATQIAMQEGNATSTAATRLTAKAQIDSIIDSAVALGNTKYQNDYLFGGNDVTDAPLSNTPPFYTGAAADSGAHTTEIAAGQIFKSNHNAKEIFLDTGTLQALKDLSTALGANDTVGIAAASASLQSAQQGIQAVVGDLGARENQLDNAGSNLDALKTNLTTFKSSLSEVDQETAITELVTRQTAYQSAMLATSRVIGMTLTDYLK
jgi:flagellar hook-associated protein 3 FlgL